jgi:flagellar assembly factor FliW
LNKLDDGGSKMTLDTRHFGTIEVEEQDIVIFPEGLPGFEDNKRFTLLGKGEVGTTIFWLQSVDDPMIALVVLDPFAIYEDYYVDVDDGEVSVLNITDQKHLLTLCVMVIPEDVKQSRVNLRAPILINLENNIGKQILQRNEDLPIRYFLMQ